MLSHPALLCWCGVDCACEGHLLLPLDQITRLVTVSCAMVMLHMAVGTACCGIQLLVAVHSLYNNTGPAVAQALMT